MYVYLYCRRLRQASGKKRPEELPNELVDAYAKLTFAATSLLERQWHQHHDYETHYAGYGRWVVNRNPVALKAATAAAKDKRIGPTYFRTRIVSAVPSVCGSYLFLRCTCGFYDRCMIPCRHILSAKHGHLSLKHDVHPMYFSLYGTAYLPPTILRFDEANVDGPRLEGVGTDVVADVEQAYKTNGDVFSDPHVPFPTKHGVEDTIVYGIGADAVFNEDNTAMEEGDDEREVTTCSVHARALSYADWKMLAAVKMGAPLAALAAKLPPWKVDEVLLTEHVHTHTQTYPHTHPRNTVNRYHSTQGKALMDRVTQIALAHMERLVHDEKTPSTEAGQAGDLFRPSIGPGENGKRGKGEYDRHVRQKTAHNYTL